MAATNKTVLITGATRGIGLELAAHYKKNGWNVIGAARDVTKADSLKALAPYKLVALDAGDEASILAAAKSLEGEPIDLLINNAGILEGDSFESPTKEALMRQFEIDAVGPFLVTRAFVANLRAAAAKNGSALVAQIGSYMGSITLNDGSIGTGIYGYRTAKTGLHMINSCLALDLKKDSITAVTLHLGYVTTEITSGNGQINAQESVAGMTKVLEGVKASRRVDPGSIREGNEVEGISFIRGSWRTR